MDITISDMIAIVKYGNKLEDLVFSICINNFIYFLSHRNETHNYRRCNCNSLISRFRGIMVEDKTEEEYSAIDENWKYLVKLFKENRTIKSLGLNFYCRSNDNSGNDSNLVPDYLIKKFCSLFEFNQTLFKFSVVSSISLQLCKQLLQINTAITTYNTIIYNDRETFRKEKEDILVYQIKPLLLLNQNIKTLKYTQRVFNQKEQRFDENVLINFSKL
ncbi:hypothetical protein DICPUDRAFT_91582 [Dictyostelium purpureum]|uniref:Uncharacterized protein n=1 Tax=Dictyostelium purpureum TaxID=5786 RepID=F0ZEH0_DICPU|nr:uncharacterized protein DICPUDRAFT_91582 [Dictyostelium purpureum]EGC37645.1 hypothetical protein DICPUDRAFT_91582 [Dictyostelium purpureum]|eukprot:XP_003285833.1 hypothetical protein DICPUDRAFT_91582 [Dictyostelium purpureum]